MKKSAKDCKVILGESVVSQHRVLVADWKLSKPTPKPKPKPVEKVKWINLEKKSFEVFIDEMKNWLQDCIDASDELSTNELWLALRDCCLIQARKHLGISKGPLSIKKESWWLTEETKKGIADKKKAFKEWTICDSNL